MTYEARLDEAIKDAMRARKTADLACLRMIKALVAEKRTAPGFTGGVTDELVQGVIASYSKKLAKTIEEVEKTGRGDSPVLESYRYEIELLKDWLPTKLDEAATRDIVRGLIADSGISGPAAAGRLIGMVMKNHREQVDPVLVRKVIDQELAG
ncbi:GatB/YqeY domain-containing protein [Myxococcota bacterium]|nr:GatB/YqeY domain-containing protein [Myxococcota bacterium]